MQSNVYHTKHAGNSFYLKNVALKGEVDFTGNGRWKDMTTYSYPAYAYTQTIVRIK